MDNRNKLIIDAFLEHCVYKTREEVISAALELLMYEHMSNNIGYIQNEEEIEEEER